MSRTDKDRPSRLREEGEWDKWYRPRNPNPKRGRSLARYYTDGPGGVHCGCCGVSHGYKAQERRKVRLEILSELESLSL